MQIENIAVVLVESQGARNIGSVCRAMKNFGYCDLRLVNPQVDYLADEARHMAVKAVDILESAQIFPDLESALADIHVALGTTRRFGRYRRDVLHPEEASTYLSQLADDQRAAFILGREDSGLKTSELDLCQRLLTIPVFGELGSLNVSQAAVLLLYEAARAIVSLERKEANERRLAAGDELEAMFGQMQESFMKLGYLNTQNPTHIMRTYRQLFGRAALNPREVRIVRGLLSRIDWLEGERQRLLQAKDGS